MGSRKARSRFIRWLCGDDSDVASTAAPVPEDVPEPVPAGPMKAIELRVHGVSGTSPEALLDRPAVAQVAGDKIAGFYSPRFEDERTDNAPNPFAKRRTRAPEMEGYNWGGLTSGSPGRALWLLLLPFTLINIAPRARPNDIGGKAAKRTWLIWYLSRALALLLTLLFILAGIGAGEDLVGWQCRRGSYCSESLPKFFLEWLKHPGTDPDIASNLGPLFVGAFIPGVMLFILWFVSGRTLNRYESVGVHGTNGDPDPAGVDALEAPLSSPWMWRNQEQVRRLRAIHVQCGIAMILWTLTLPIQKPWGSSHTTASGLWAVLDTIWLELSSHLWSLAPAVVLIYGFVVLGRRTYVGRAKRPVWRTLSGVIWVALAVLTIGIAWVQLHDGAVNQGWVENSGRPTASLPKQLPGFNATLVVVLVVMAILLAVLLVVVWVSATKQDATAPEGSEQTDLAPGLTGRTSVALSILAVLLGAAFAAAIYSYAATWLHSGSLKPSRGQVAEALATFDPPVAFRVATMAVVVSVVTAVVILVVVGVRTIIGVGPGGWGKVAGVPRHALERDYQSEQGALREKKGRRRTIERAVFVATFVERIPVVAAWLVAVGTAITLGFGALLVSSQLKPEGQAAKFLDGDISSEIVPLETSVWKWLVSANGQAWGAYFTVLGLLGLVAVAAAAFRVPATRRVVGIVWDVASFWPRSCHPLAAPCYAERTVPDLVTRVHYYCAKDRPVVLAAHSQGTVLSAAVIAHLEGDPRTTADLERISLLTFGCVLRRLYARYFPVYFGLAFLTQLQALLTRKGDTDPRWINLWRYTDYLGGQVTDGPPQHVPCTPSARVDREALLRVAPVAWPTTWEWHSPDPPLFGIPPGSTTYLKPHRHSDFWSDDSGIFQLAVVTLAGRHEADD
jgi:hypothetical protein